jgi:hypothetical protein
MLHSSSPAEGRTKRDSVKVLQGGGETGSIDEIYTPVFSRARGVFTVYLFFFRLIGFKGLSYITLGYRTHMTISFEHLRVF